VEDHLAVAHLVEGGEGAEVAVDLVADTARLQDDVVGVRDDDLAAQPGDHRRPAGVVPALPRGAGREAGAPPARSRAAAMASSSAGLTRDAGAGATWGWSPARWWWQMAAAQASAVSSGPGICSTPSIAPHIRSTWRLVAPP
jgi:hypothetical protein